MTVARGGKRGKTAGRGGKGQSARAGNKRRPEWRDIIKKLPKLRGRGVNQNKPVSDPRIIVNISTIEANFSAGAAITPTTLIEQGIVSTSSGRTPSIKILGDGEVTKSFKVSGCAISESAKSKIEKAGGTVAMYGAQVIKKNKGHAGNAPTVSTKPAPAKKAEKAPKKEKSAKTDKAPKADKPVKQAKAPKTDKPVAAKKETQK